MAHQMNQYRSEEQTQPMMNQAAIEPTPRTASDCGQGGLLPTEPQRDETGYAMPPDAMMSYDSPPQTWRAPESNWNVGMPVPGTGMGGMGMGGMGPSSAFAQSQRMKNPVDMETTHNPTNARDAYQASLRSLLARNVGYFIVASFLVGTGRMVTWQGILHTVGSDYLVIYQPDYERYISCDFYALKFVQFHNTVNTPYCVASHTWVGRES